MYKAIVIQAITNLEKYCEKVNKDNKIIAKIIDGEELTEEEKLCDDIFTVLTELAIQTSGNEFFAKKCGVTAEDLEETQEKIFKKMIDSICK